MTSHPESALLLAISIGVAGRKARRSRDPAAGSASLWQTIIDRSEAFRRRHMREQLTITASRTSVLLGCVAFVGIVLAGPVYAADADWNQVAQALGKKG